MLRIRDEVDEHDDCLDGNHYDAVDHVDVDVGVDVDGAKFYSNEKGHKSLLRFINDEKRMV